MTRTPFRWVLAAALAFVVIPASAQAGAIKHRVSLPGVTVADAVPTDLDHNDRLDLLAIAKTDTAQTLLPLLQQPDGSFAAGTGSPISGSPGHLELTDLNGDGRKDAVLSGPDRGSDPDFHTSVMLQAAGGGFDPASFTGPYCGSYAVADIDGDGDKDLVGCDASENDAPLQVYLNGGAGHFTAGQQTSASYGRPGLAKIQAGDFDGDGDPDVAVGGPNGDGQVHVLRNDAGVLTDTTAVNANDFAVGDMDGDGRDDIVGDEFVSYGGPALAFTSVAAGFSGYGFHVGQFAFGPALDVARVRTPFSDISHPVVFPGNGDRTFDTVKALDNLSRVGVAYSIEDGDLNGDGLSDLVVATQGQENGLDLFYTTTPSTAALTHSPSLPHNGETVTLDAGGSRPGLGETKYTWDLRGDGRYTVDTGTTPTLTTTFATSGAHTVRVKVSNGDTSGTEDAVAEDTIYTGDPFGVDFTTTPTGDLFAPADVTVHSSASGGFAPYRYEIDYQRNGGAVTTVSSASADQTLRNLSAGSYHVTVTAKDDKQQTARAEHDLTVYDHVRSAFVEDDGRYNPGANRAVHLTATSDRGVGTLHYEWSVDSGPYAPGNGATPDKHTVTFADDGPHTVRLRTTDSANPAESDVATRTFNESVVPVLKATFDAAPGQTLPSPSDPVTLDASDTHGGNGPYRFAFDEDGSGTYVPASGPMTSPRTFTAGDHEVGVEVTDADGNTEHVRITVRVRARLAATAATSAGLVGVGGHAQLTATASGGEGTKHYAWDLDGVVDANDHRAYETTNPNGDTEPTLDATFDTAGRYDVGLRVTDGTGAIAYATVHVDVGDPIHAVLTQSDPSPTVGYDVEFDASGTTGGVPPLAYQFVDTNGVHPYSSSSRHTVRYHQTGPQQVIVRVRDGAGRVETVTKDFTVLGGLGISTRATPKEAQPNQPMSITATATGGTGRYSHYFFKVDGQAEVDNGSSPTRSFSFPANGTYTVAVRVVDDAGHASGSVEQKLYVADAVVARLSHTPDYPSDGRPTFDATASSGGIPPYTYRWDWDKDGTVDETTSSGTVAHTYAAAGVQTAKVEVVDSQDASGSATDSVTIPDHLFASVKATPDLAGRGQTITVDASASSGGVARRFQFDLDGDGTYETPVSASAQATTSFATVGGRDVGVRVTDVMSSLPAATATVHIDVADPLVAALSFSPAHPFAGNQVTLDASGSHDGVAPLSYRFDLNGDGGYETATGSTAKTTFTPTGSHSKVGVQVTDKRGQVKTATVEFDTPAAIKPSFTVSPAVRDTDTPLTLDASATTGGIGPYSYAWDLNNDGRFDNVAADGTSPRLTDVKLSSGTVGLRVTDKRGDQATTSQVLFIPPPLGASLSLRVRGRAPATVASAATASGGHGPYTFALQVDGGDFASIGTAAFGADRDLTMTAGAHTVVLKVTDADGRTATATQTATVIPPLVAGFTFTPSDPEVGATTTFQSSASGGAAPYTYAWQFSDGSSASGPRATKTFTREGDAGATLVVTDAQGVSERVQKQFTVVPSCTDTIEFAVTQVKTDGCLKKHVDRDKGITYYDTSDRVKMNGLPINPGKVKVKFTLPTKDAPGGKVGGDVTVRFNGSDLFTGDLNYKLPDGKADGKEQLVASLAIPGKGFSIKGFKVDGAAALSIGRESSGRYFSKVDLNVALPNVFRQGPDKGDGGVTGAAGIVVDDNGPRLNGVEIHVKNAWVGQLQVEDACFSYVSANSKSAGSCSPPNLDTVKAIACRGQADAERWDGSAVVVLPTDSKPRLAAYGGTTNGQLAYFGGYADNLHIEVFPEVFFNRIGIGLCLNPPPLKLKGDLGMTAFATGRGDLLKVNGHIQYQDAYTDDKGNDQPWVISAGGDISVLDRRIADGEASFQATGSIDFRMHVGQRFPDDTSLPRLASIDGNAVGWIEPLQRTFNVDGDVTACIGPEFLEGCLGAKAAVSTVGLGACGIAHSTFGDASVGVGYRWTDKSPDIFASSCDLGPYRQRRTRALLGGAGKAFTLPGKQAAVALRLHGEAGPPRVLLTGPDGTQLTSGTTGGVYDPKRIIAIEDTETNTTNILLVGPAAGQWSVAAQPGSPAITAVDQADPVPHAKATAKVVKVGRRYRLRTRYTLAPSDAITFVEKGPKAQQTIGKATAKLCSPGSTQMCDDLPFKPKFGPAGKRKLLALVTRDGIPIDQIEVGSYQAPHPPRPARVERMRLVRVGKSVVVAWKRHRIQGHYQAVVETGDGKAQIHLPKPGCSAVRVKGVRRGTSVRASVWGIRRDLKSGPHAVIRLKGRHGYRAHLPRLRKKLGIAARCI